MRSGRAAVAMAGLWYLAASTGGSADAAQSTAWSRGLALYKQSKFRQACPLLSQAAASAPENGAIWADLALCELKRGDRPASIHASLLAARWGDERTRKNAYFNLHLAGYALDLAEECSALAPPAELACGAPVFACSTGWRAYGTAEGDDGSLAVFASSLKDVQAMRDDAATSDGANGIGQVLLSQAHVCFPSWCNMHAWHCDESAVVDRRAKSCLRKALGRLPTDPCLQPGRACETFEDCRDEACSAAEAVIEGVADAKPWPALEREHDQRVASCASHCTEEETLSCSVVFVDPCRNHVGYVCVEPGGSGKRKPARAGEVALTE